MSKPMAFRTQLLVALLSTGILALLYLLVFLVADGSDNLGAGRDRVWASGSMTANIVASMRRAGRGGQVQTLVSPESGHSLCGNGQWPYRAYEPDRDDPQYPDLDRQGAAEVAAHQAKLAFLAAALRR